MAVFKSVDDVKRLIAQRTERILDAFVTDTIDTVRERTPEDEGNARAQWERTPVGPAAVGTTFVIGNDAPYILKLEYGGSRQAPQGMARVTVAESQARLDAVVARFNT